MNEFNYEEIESEILKYVGMNVVAAKEDIADFLKSKKENLIEIAQGYTNGTIPAELVKSQIEDTKTVISGILLAHMVIAQVGGMKKAKVLALTLAKKLAEYLIAYILKVPIKL